MRAPRLALALLGRAARGLAERRALDAFYRRRLNILCYHGVRDGDDRVRRIFVAERPERLRADLARLARIFDFVPLDTLLSGPPPAAAGRPRLAVTFDDGLALGDGALLDILGEFAVRATMLVATAAIGNPDLLWQHKLAAIAAARGERFVAAFNRLVARTGSGRPILRPDRHTRAAWLWPAARKEELADQLWRDCAMPPVAELLQAWRPYAGWAELDRWVAAGHRIGSHSRSHPNCAALGDAEIESEIVAPAALLCERFGYAAVPFAYPFGQRLPPAREAALADCRVLSCLLGTDGLSPWGTPPHRLERAETAPGLPIGLFARPLLSAALRPA
ncbi:MAG: polysaccharide deacetylase family protein [Dongiaceae bacterium]